MDKKPIISVVFPAYNEARVISRTLNSLAKQDATFPFEVVVVNNNSSDNTAEIVNKFAEEYPDFRVITEKKPGIGQARRTGHDNARGEIFVGTDADVELPPNWLSRIYEKFQAKPKIAGLVGTYVFYDASGFVNFFFHIVMVIGDLVGRLIMGNYGFRGNNFAVRSEIYQKSGGFNPEISALEDIDLAMRVAKLGKIAYYPNLTIKMTSRRFRGNILKQTTKRLRAFYYRAIKKDNTKATDWDIVR